MDFQKLKEIVLEETDDLPNNFRCHEVARRIGGHLHLLGLKVEVKDGIAVYDTSSLLRDFVLSMNILEGLPEEAKSELMGRNIKKKIRVFHSWCEVADEENDTIVIDWHALLKLSQEESLERILIIERKNNLPHSYFPVGRVVGKWIILKRFPPYATRLRM